MKKNELKQILKPLIKECIKECIFEEGVLSGIITEVVRGMETQRVVTEGVTIKKNEDDGRQRQAEEEYERQRQEKIKKLNESVSFGSSKIDIFEGTKPTAGASDAHAPLSGVAPDDAGVNIDGLLGVVGKKWNALK